MLDDRSSTSRTSRCATACTPSATGYTVDQVRPDRRRARRGRRRRHRGRPRRRPAGVQPQLRPGAHTDWRMDRGRRRGASRTRRLTTLLLPGIGTIARPEARPRRSACTRVRVATHCTEADIAAQHIAKARELGMDVVRLPDDVPHGRARPTWPAQAKLMESLRRALRLRHRLRRPAARWTTCATASAPTATCSTPETQIGIHAHHNLSLGVANSVVGRRGRRRPRRRLARPGMGAGAGNCPARGRSSPSPNCRAGSTAATCSR